MEPDANCRFFILQLNQVIPQLQLALSTFNPHFTFVEMVDFVIQAHYLPTETRWEELKEEIVNVIIQDPKCTAHNVEATIYQYEWCVQNAERLIDMIQSGYCILYHYLNQYIPYAVTDGYVYDGLSVVRQGMILKYSRQDIF